MTASLRLVRPVGHETQLRDLLAERATHEAATAEIDARLLELRRAYSVEHGHCVTLSVEQMLRAVEADKRAPMGRARI